MWTLTWVVVQFIFLYTGPGTNMFQNKVGHGISIVRIWIIISVVKMVARHQFGAKTKDCSKRKNEAYFNSDPPSTDMDRLLAK